MQDIHISEPGTSNRDERPRQQASLSSKWADYSQKVTASLEIKTPRGHLLVLDGVRAVACLAVLLHHIVYHVVLPQHWSGLWKPSGPMQGVLAALLSFAGSGVILFLTPCRIVCTE